MRIDVKAKNGEFHFDCEEGEQVLYAGLRQGIELPYECATGTCGTCKARVGEDQGEPIVNGWQEAPGRAYLKPKRGEFLMCQASARGSCRIVVPSKLNGADDHGRPGYRNGVIGDLRTLNPDVVDFRVRLDAPMSFRAGQFACLETPGVEGFRAYSMVNYDTNETDELHFVVKRKPDGAFSKALFDGRIDGAATRVFGPLGKAVFDPAENRNVLCMAGGSGIAGMMSIARHVDHIDYCADHHMRMFFGVRSERDTFYLDELAELAERHVDRMSVWIVLSEEDPGEALRAAYPSLGFDTGFVHEVMGRRMQGLYQDSVAFVAGPPPMVDGVLRLLIIDGRLPASDIRYDKFS